MTDAEARQLGQKIGRWTFVLTRAVVDGWVLGQITGRLLSAVFSFF